MPWKRVGSFVSSIFLLFMCGKVYSITIVFLLNLMTLSSLPGSFSLVTNESWCKVVLYFMDKIIVFLGGLLNNIQSYQIASSHPCLNTFSFSRFLILIS